MKLYSEKGFTLVELLIGMAIMGIIMGGLSTLFASTVKVHSVSTAKTSNIRDASTVATNIAEELKYAISQNVVIITPGTGVTRTHTYVDTVNSYVLATGPATGNTPAIVYIPITTTGGIQFTRDVFTGGVSTGLQTRRIRLLNNTAVMDYGNAPQSSTWTIVKSVDLSTGANLVSATALSGIPLLSGSIESLTFKVEQMPDLDISDYTARRKKITVTVVANATGLKSQALNTTATDTQTRSATFTTTVVTNN